MDCSKIKVVKKDGTKEEFNVKKVLAAISKSAERAMITFSRAEKNFICEFVEEKAEEMDQELILLPRCTIMWKALWIRSTAGCQKLPGLPEL